MARKYSFKAGRYGWNLEKCEEELLVAAYQEVRGSIPPDQHWKADFESYFDQGHGIAVEYIAAINAVRKRRRLGEIVIRETDVSDYAGWADRQTKSKRRRAIREEFGALSGDELGKRLAVAGAETVRLPPPRTTFEQFMSRQEQQRDEATG